MSEPLDDAGRTAQRAGHERPGAQRQEPGVMSEPLNDAGRTAQRAGPERPGAQRQERES